MRADHGRPVGTTAFIVITGLWLLWAVVYVSLLLARREGVIWHIGDYAVPVGRDFNVYWAAANAAADGRLSEIFDRSQFWHLRQELLGQEFQFMGAWLYPPHYLLLLAPFALIPYIAGYALFTGGTLLAYLGAAWRLGVRRTGIAALVLAPTTFYCVEMGQNGFLTAALFVPGIALMQRRPILAGTLFGLLTFKPTIGLLVIVALCAARAWKAAFAAVFCASALAGLATLVYGVDAWTMLLRQPAAIALDISMGSDAPNVRAMVSVLPRASAVLGNTAAAYCSQALLAALAAAITYRVFRVSTDAPTRTVVVATGTCLATPYFFFYDLPMLTLALALYAQSHEMSARQAPLMIALWFLPVVVIFAPLFTPALIVSCALIQQWWRVEPRLNRASLVASGVADPA